MKDNENVNKKLHMLNFILKVGNDEKHTIECTLNQFYGYIEIKVDEELFIRKRLKNVRFKQNWTIDLVVGSWEIHDIKIQIVKSIFPVGLRDCSAWVTIDGEKTGEYNGKVSYKDNLFTAMNIKTKAVIITSWVILFLMVISLILYHVPIKIDKEMNGVLFRAGSTDPDYQEQMLIVIDGKYYKKLFSDNQFVGKIYIDDLYPDIGEKMLHEEQVINFSKIGQQALWKIRQEKYPCFPIYYGSIYMDSNGDHVMLNIDDKGDEGYSHWSSSDGLIYFAESNNREEAIILANEMVKKVWKKDAYTILKD